MLVRRERPADVADVRAAVGAAFARDPGEAPVEAGLLDALRADPGWLPQFSLVVLDGGRILGHVTCTRGHIDDVPALGLGPIAVRPAEQGRGVGSALMHAVLGAAEALDEPLVALLGDPGWYRRFSFGPASAAGVATPDPEWGEYFQVRVLGDDAPTGTFRYARPFADL